jgi:DNA-binding response OmpR family regulator
VPVPLLAVVDASSAEHVLKAFQDGRRPAMLIVASDSDEAARALRLDIDDVIRAPFSREELGARLSRLVGPTTALLPFPPLLVDRGRCEVLASGKRVPLRRAEYELLMYLISQHPRVVDQREILREVFGTTGDGGAIRYHICTLRRKLLECGADIIRTVRGSGYYVEQQMNSSAEPSLGENRNVGLED